MVANLRPWLWFTDTTPTGGDLGAHVWAPAYLRDVLIGELRLTGWTHDWYAGFPAFTFYMVVPSLLVVAVDAGLGLHEAVFAHFAVALAAGAAALVVARRAGRPASQCWTIALAVAAVAGAAKLFVDAPAADPRPGRAAAARRRGLVRLERPASQTPLEGGSVGGRGRSGARSWSPCRTACH